MRKRKTTPKSSSNAVWALFLIGMLGLGALAAYVRYGGADKVPPEDRMKPAASANQTTAGQSEVDVPTPKMSGNDLKLDPDKVQVPKGQDAMVFAINEYLKKAQVTDPDAKATGVQVKDGVALIDFTPSFNQTLGAFDERTLLQGLAKTLSQFPGVEKMQFFVEGQPVTTLGNVDLTVPISVKGEVVDPAPAATTVGVKH